MSSEDRNRKRFAKNTVMQYGLQAAKYFFPFITIPYLTRVLEPETYAVRAYVLAAMVIMQVFLDYGFNSYGTKRIAESADDRQSINQTVTSITILRFLLFAIGAAVMALVVVCIPLLSRNYVYVAIAYLGACFKAALPDYIFQGQEDMGIITNRYVVSHAIATILIIGLIRSPNDLLLVAIIESFAALIALVWSWQNVFYRRRIRFARVEKETLKNDFSSSSIFFLSNAATTIFNSLTTLMIGIFVSDEASISYWSIAMTAVSAIQSLYTPITNSLYPHMCKRRDFALAKRLLMIGIPVVLFGSIMFAILSEAVMLILGGEMYIEGAPIVVLLAPVLFFSFPAMLLGYPILAAIGKIKELTASSVLASSFHIIGLLILVILGVFSIPAVAILRCCTECVLLVSRVVFVYKALLPGRKSNEQ